ncbi:WAS/WASL-interacting protein family member 1-like [Pongo pygmaeus]|uniref:WAS/WASL-interacting protein family member 1-like n=1 Tax=Pongo pygmaeus TaxID=9600 RepID=UPI00300D9A09
MDEQGGLAGIPDHTEPVPHCLTHSASLLTDTRCRLAWTPLALRVLPPQLGRVTLAEAPARVESGHLAGGAGFGGGREVEEGKAAAGPTCGVGVGGGWGREAGGSGPQGFGLEERRGRAGAPIPSWAGRPRSRCARNPLGAPQYPASFLPPPRPCPPSEPQSRRPCRRLRPPALGFPRPRRDARGIQWRLLSHRPPSRAGKGADPPGSTFLGPRRPAEASPHATHPLASSSRGEKSSLIRRNGLLEAAPSSSYGPCRGCPSETRGHQAKPPLPGRSPTLARGVPRDA